MAPSGPWLGPPHDAAAKAATRREPIILQGFDRRRQLDIQFRTIQFGAVWLRRTYTNEKHKHIIPRTRTDEICLQEVRYGNNITVLLKACFLLRQFYDSRDFWPAIAKGFGASADVVRDMVELLVDARNIYRRDNPDEADIARSGANIAADQWFTFVVRRTGDSRAGGISGTTPGHDSRVHEHARTFFSESQGKHIDLADVLVKEANHYSPSCSRKRFASPEPPGQPPSPKRRTSANYYGRAETQPALPSWPSTPLSTGIQIKGAAKQNYQTLVGASKELAQAISLTHNSPTTPIEGFRKVRGMATQGENGSPSINEAGSIPDLALSASLSDEENQRAREQFARLDKELSNVKSQLCNDQHVRTIVNTILSEKKWTSVDSLSSTPDPALKSMQSRIASLERIAAEGVARRAEEIKNVKDGLKVAVGEIASLKDILVKEVESTSSHDRDDNSTLHALEKVQGRLAFLEEKLLVGGTAETRAKVASLESRVANIESQLQQLSVPIIQGMTNRLARLEDKVTAVSTSKDFGQAGLHEMQGKIMSLENEVTWIKTQPDEGEDVLEAESRAAVTEPHQEGGQEEYATKKFVETAFEQLDMRLTGDKDAAAKQLQDIQQRLTTTENLSSRLTKTIEVLQKSKCSCPPQAIQRNMDEVCKKTDRLPTEASITDMILKRDQVSKSENEKLWRAVDDISTKINSHSTACASGRFFRLEHNLRAELERHQKDTNSLVNANEKHLETLQAQIKGLNKLWNEATTGIAKSDSLLALEAKVDGLKDDTATQSKRLDILDQNLHSLRDDTIPEFGGQITDLSTQLRTTLSEVSPTDFSRRFKEVQRKVDAISFSTTDQKIESLAAETETLYHRISILASALNEMGQLVRPVGLCTR